MCVRVHWTLFPYTLAPPDGQLSNLSTSIHSPTDDTRAVSPVVRLQHKVSPKQMSVDSDGKERRSTCQPAEDLSHLGEMLEPRSTTKVTGRSCLLLDSND